MFSASNVLKIEDKSTFTEVPPSIATVNVFPLKVAEVKFWLSVPVPSANEAKSTPVPPEMFNVVPDKETF